MPEKLSLLPVMTYCPSVRTETNIILEPLLAILAIVVPLGLAYIILLLQARKSAGGCPKASAITHNDLLHKMAKLARAEEKHTAR